MSLLTTNYGPPCQPCCEPPAPSGSTTDSVLYVFDPIAGLWRTLSAPGGILELGDPVTPTNPLVVSPCSPGGIPGPKGDPGDPGAAGMGINAYTVLMAGFTVPIIGTNVSIQVASTAWMAIGQPIFITSAGFYLIISITDATHVVIQNLGYPGNAVAGISIANAQSVVAAGVQGAAGASGSGVTSVSLSVPSWYSVSGSPITTTGTLALTPATGQLQNRVIASPDGSAGAISLRLLVSNDIPNLSASKITSGQIAIANGGTGQNSSTSGFNALSPLTTKGDLIGRDGTNNIRIGVGTNGQILTADSAATPGVSWQTPSSSTPVIEDIQLSTPTTGSNVVFDTQSKNITLYLTPAGTLATLSLTLPADANSFVGQICRAFTSQTLTALSVAASGGTIVGTAVTALSQYGSIIFQKVAANTWIRLQ